MKVAIDARRLQDRPLTGAGRWLANLAPLLAEQTEVVLLTDARRPPAPGALPQQALSLPQRLPELCWLQGSVARWLRGKQVLFHGTFNALPLIASQPSVVTIFDLSFEHHPEDFAPAKRQLFRVQARWAAHHARMIITISDHARRSIIETYDVDPARVVIAPPAVDAVFASPPAVNDLLRSRGVRGPYVVAIGGARRRGLEVAVAAWRTLRAEHRDLALVVVGREDPGRAPGLVHLGRIDDRTWAGVLSGAQALCYPTRFEGFGMPALEAAACGVPVVVGRVGPIPEVVGDAAAWCEPSDPASVSQALGRVLSDHDHRDELRRRGLARVAAAPTWETSAETVLDAYRQAQRER